MPKVEVAKKRVLDINPIAKVNIFQEFYLPTNTLNILDNTITYIVDAMDTVSAKMQLIEEAKAKRIPIISSMGTGNKLEPNKFEISDIYETSVCPLAKIIRKECRKRGIEKLKVISSKEEPQNIEKQIDKDTGKQIAGTVSYIPSLAGLMIAGEVIKDLVFRNDKRGL